MGEAPDNGAAGLYSLDRWHIVTVKRKNGALYTTSFYACSDRSVMFLNPRRANRVLAVKDGVLKKGKGSRPERAPQ